MPTLEALYYPQWDPPSKWLRSSLLFFDKVSVIVPTAAQPEYGEANLRLRDVLPDTFVELREDRFDPQLDDAQLAALAAALDDIAENDENDDDRPWHHQETAALHDGKVPYKIASMLRKRGLIIAQQDEFIHTNTRVAYLILSLLADRYGTRKGLWTVTDDAFGYSLNVLGSRDAAAEAAAENQLATAILSASVPAEIEELEPENFVELRKRYEPLRASFQTAVRDISRDARIRVIDEAEALAKRIDDCTSEFVEGVAGIRSKSLGKRIEKWVDFGMGTVVDISTSLMDVHLPGTGLAAKTAWGLTLLGRSHAPETPVAQTQRLIAGLQKDLVAPSMFRRLQERIRARRR